MGTRLTQDEKRTRMRRAAICCRAGENIMPNDCARIIRRNFSLPRRVKLGAAKLDEMICDLMQAAGCCDESSEWTRDEAESLTSY